MITPGVGGLFRVIVNDLTGLAPQASDGYPGAVKQRKKQPGITRQAILEAAGEGFATQGYAATGLGTIVSRAGLTKGALFHHFHDKLSLAADWIASEIQTGIEADWIRPLEDIHSLDGLKSLCRSRCLELNATDPLSALVAITAETAHSEPALRDASVAVFTALRQSFADLIERGKSSGWIHRSIQPASEAAFIVSSVAGLTVTSKADPTDATRRAGADALGAYLETLRAQ